MRVWKKIPIGLAWIVLLLPSFVLAGAQQAAGPAAESTPLTRLVAYAQPSSPNGLPDSPSAIYSKLQKAENQASALKTQSGPNAPAQPQTAESEAQPQSPPSLPPVQKPVGTAAAEPAEVTGVAASQPAGMAIAPAKQRRARTILLRVGAIVGGGVAVGTVYALTRATSSKPPGTK